MPLPAADKAFVETAKIVDYLLNLDHPVGGSKAQWFIRLGYDPDDPERLRDDLIKIAHSCEDFSEQQTSRGVKYIATGTIVSPADCAENVRTIWIVEPDTSGPRLVTAYPGKARQP